MPNRIIKDSIWTSPNFNQLSEAAERCFYRILLSADDWGCFEASPMVIRGKCYPLQPATELACIEKCLTELESAGIIKRWQRGNRNYGQFVTFEQHNNLSQKHEPTTPCPPWMLENGLDLRLASETLRAYKKIANAITMLSNNGSKPTYKAICEYAQCSPSTLSKYYKYLQDNQLTTDRFAPLQVATGATLETCSEYSGGNSGEDENARCSAKTPQNESTLQHTTPTTATTSKNPNPNVVLYTTTTTTIGLDQKVDIMLSTYKKNISRLTPIVKDEIKKMAGLYPDGWFEDAVKEAVLNNKQGAGMRYIITILERWAKEGRMSPRVSENNQGGNGHLGERKDRSEGKSKESTIEFMGSLSLSAKEDTELEKVIAKHPEWNDMRKAIFDGLYKRRGYRLPDGRAAGEGKAMNWMFKEGYTPEQILNAYDQLKAEPFWQAKTLTINSVATQIGEIIHGGNNGGKKYSGQPGNKSSKNLAKFVEGGENG